MDLQRRIIFLGEINHPDLTVSNVMEKSISVQRGN